MGDKGPVVVFGGCCCCFLLFVSIILFACSFAVLTPHEQGLNYNGISRGLETKTYPGGRYFLGLGHYFRTFPRKLQYVEFSSSSEGGSRNTVVNAWSRDGQEILLEMGFYFQVVPDTLAALFYEYTEDGYLPVIEDIATNTFRDVSTKHDTLSFFENRTGINSEMHEELQKRLNEHVHVNVPRFNLLSIKVPNKFENAIIAKVVTEQEKNTLEFEQKSSVIQEEIEVIQAGANKDIVILRAETQKNATIKVKAAEAAAFETVNVEMASLRKALADGLGFNGTTTTNYTDLMHYMWLDVVRGAAGNSRLVFNAPNVLLDL